MLTWSPYRLPKSTARSICFKGYSLLTDQSSFRPHTQYDKGKRTKSNPRSAIVAKSNSSNAGRACACPGGAKLPCRLKPRQRGMRLAVMSSMASRLSLSSAGRNLFEPSVALTAPVQAAPEIARSFMKFLRSMDPSFSDDAMNKPLPQAKAVYLECKRVRAGFLIRQLDLQT